MGKMSERHFHLNGRARPRSNEVIANAGIVYGVRSSQLAAGGVDSIEFTCCFNRRGPARPTTKRRNDRQFNCRIASGIRPTPVGSPPTLHQRRRLCRISARPDGKRRPRAMIRQAGVFCMQNNCDNKAFLAFRFISSDASQLSSLRATSIPRLHVFVRRTRFSTSSSLLLLLRFMFFVQQFSHSIS